MSDSTTETEKREAAKRIVFPSYKWFTGNDMENSCNEWNGTYGTDPETGYTDKTTLAFRAWIDMPPKPGKNETSPVPLNIPFGFKVVARLIYPFGHKPAQGEPQEFYYKYEPTGGEPKSYDFTMLAEGERWINDLLEGYIADGTIIAVNVPEDEDTDAEE